MKDRLRFTVLGCGSSPGVPRPNGDWGLCDPNNPKNFRYRTSLLVERINSTGDITTVVIDTGPDFREQMINAQVHHIDAVVYTHSHADHIHGIDDLRSFVLGSNTLMNIFADSFTLKRLYEAFGYCFETPQGSNYPPILKSNEINNLLGFSVNGQGGEIIFQPHLQIHGDIHSLGFRIGNVAYCTDISAFPEKSLKNLYNLDVLIIDALQYLPHPSHFSLNEALEWISELKPKRAILTHMHTFLDYDKVMAETPDHVEPAYQGLVFEIAIS